jgi:hypothetical protein
MKREYVFPLVALTVVALTACACADGEPVKTNDNAPQSTARPAAPPEPRRPQPMRSTPAQAPPASGAAARKEVGYRGPLPPIPMSPQAAGPPEVIRAIYEFAARRPDVMRHVPCFCGCERNGHQDNEDCFVASRAADGRPEWDTHGLA